MGFELLMEEVGEKNVRRFFLLFITVRMYVDVQLASLYNRHGVCDEINDCDPG